VEADRCKLYLKGDHYELLKLIHAQLRAEKLVLFSEVDRVW
jgi:hypothetical protein